MSRRLERPSLVAPSLAVAALGIGVGLSAIRAAAAGNGLYDLDLFAGTGVLDNMPDVDDALYAGMGALKAGVMRLYGVVVLVGGWVRIVRYSHGVNLLVRLAGLREIRGGFSAEPFPFSNNYIVARYCLKVNAFV
jgi:hypothetical protein